MLKNYSQGRSSLYSVGTLKNANTAIKYSPPAAEKEARNLRNFFPFWLLLEEEEVLELEEEEPFPDEDLDSLKYDSLDECLLQANWKN